MTETLVRISKLLAARGVCSRREADHYLEQGLVRVDGRPAVLGERAAPDARITLAPGARARQERRITILMNKPLGYVSGQPEKGYQSAHVLLTPEAYAGPAPPPRVPQGLAIAGRLDIDSQGLLVLTEDGRVARLLIGGNAIEKEYHVRVDAPIDDAALEVLRGPLALDGKPLRPAGIERLGADALAMTLTEGRKRQIRRMLKLVGHEVRGLKRVRIGRIRLGGLKPGQWRVLATGERF
ncbi:MAG: pseudouridine synthase [Acidiferrobacter sp.]